MSEASANVNLSLRVEGMTCASCVARVESAIHKTAGVQNARVNLATETATVEASRETSADAVVQAIRSAGYDAVVNKSVDAGDVNPSRRLEQRLREHRQAIVVAFGIGLPVMALHWFGPVLGSRFNPGAHFWPGFLQALLVTMLLISPAGGPILAAGARAVWHRSANMDVLIGLGVGTAYLSSVVALFIPRAHINYFGEAAMILMFINVGRYLEARARRSAAGSLAALTGRMPRLTTRVTNGRNEQVPVSTVQPGDRLVVGAESYIPVDGRVVQGRASIDQSMWTGEPIPVDVGVDDLVKSGAYVQSGAIHLEATEVGERSAMSRIVSMVQEAQASKSDLQRLADRVAGVFVPIAVVVGVVTFVVWSAVTHQVGPGLAAMIGVLVIACPCAMGLATPTAVLVSTTAAALKGIIVRDAAALERAGRASVILFDKTGTLTTGKLRVVDVQTHGDHDADAVLQIAASAEQFSPHPLAKAIVEHAKRQDMALVEPDGYNAEAGLGVRATIDGRMVVVGSAAFLRAQGVEIADSGDPRVCVARDSIHMGDIVLADSMRDGAGNVVRSLQSDSLETVLVTGDQREAAACLADALGIDHVEAEVSPGRKKEVVERYQQRAAQVIMVGDGVNDAPALAAADIGIAMGGGTDVAAETAPITLVNDSLESISTVIRLARDTSRVIKQNLFWAFAYNAVGIPLAATGVIPPRYAAAAMMASSISVVLNSLRLRKILM